MTEVHLDEILRQLGNFGRFQKKNCFLIFFLIVFVTMFSLSYVFTARNTKYRCLVPECESNDTDFYAKKAKVGIPMYGDEYSKCSRYKAINSSGTCKVENFDRSKTEKCTSFIYETDETTIANSFNLKCEENLWKLTLVGTINNLGLFCGMPLSGFLSDRWGRRTLLLGGLFLSVIVGVLRAFAPNYTMFLIFEFLDPFLSAGAYASGFILGLELVEAKERVLCGTLISSACAVGGALTGIAAYAFPHWRSFLLAMYIPGFIILAFFWHLPESVRWLLSNGQSERAKGTLREAAATNGTKIEEETLNKLSSVEELSRTRNSSLNSYKELLKHPKILLRLINCSYCWITCAMVYYGLSLTSVAVSGNIYINFILVSLVEIPGYAITYFTLDVFGRRSTLFSSLIISGASCFAFPFVPNDFGWMSLALYLVGKCSITTSFTILYFYTSELFPTPLRHTLLGICSTVGRCGSMLAPQAPLLAYIWAPLPLFIFGTVSTTSAFLILLFPETLHIKLPDTIEDCVKIGMEEIQTVVKSKGSRSVETSSPKGQLA